MFIWKTRVITVPILKISYGEIKKIMGWVRWFMPVILALWEAEPSGSCEVRSSKPAWPTW